MLKSELPALTGIRFYAALLVYLSHVPIIPGGEALVGQRLLFNAGVVGVSFFFVLSGFILTYNYADIFKHGVSKRVYTRFIWDRLTKIYPVHLLALLLVLPIAAFSPNLPLDWRAFPVHLLLLQCFWPSRLGSYLNVPSWSISCEWFFYLLAPSVIFAVGRRTGRWITAAVAGGYVCGFFCVLRSQSDYAKLNFVSWFAPTRFLEFLVGIVIACLFINRPLLLVASGNAIAQMGGLGLIAAGAVLRQHAPWPFWGGLLYVPGSALLILGLAYGRTALAAHLAWPWITRLGVASYSFYLVHAPILRFIKGIYLRLGWQIHSWMGFAFVAAGVFTFIQCGALMICTIYELPVQRYLRGLLKYRSSQRTEAPSASLSSSLTV